MYESLVKIPIHDFHLDGILYTPVRAQSVIIFAHGSNSNRFSPRNKMIARELHEAGYATLLFDFMGEYESFTYEKRFDVKTLARRLVHVTGWIHSHDTCRTHDLAYFGAGMGGAMALSAAAQLPYTIKAVACRGTQTEKVDKNFIPKIHSPVLLMAGQHDRDTVRQNLAFANNLTCSHHMVEIPGAGYLMENPKMVQQVAKEAIQWFNQYLRKGQLKPEMEYDTPDTEY